MTRHFRFRPIVAASLTLLLASCSFFSNVIGSGSSKLVGGGATLSASSWTIVLYMNGDGNLSQEALSDLQSMQAANLQGTGITVLALVDLGATGGSLSGGWTGGRLYKVGFGGSQRLSCNSLGLTSTGTAEGVDMGNPSTVSALLSFAKSGYAASHYAVVFWGHASGWRSVGTDSTSADTLTVSGLAGALTGISLDVVGFDTPSEATLETMDALKAEATYQISSEGESIGPAWDLQAVLSGFAASSLTPTDFVNAVVSSYAAANGTVPGAEISAVNLADTALIVAGLNRVANDIGISVTSAASQSTIQGLIQNNAQVYDPVSPPGDEQVDLWSLAYTLQYPPPTTPATPNYSTTTDEQALMAAITSAVVSEWHSSGADSHGIAVYLASLGAGGSPASPPVDSTYTAGADPNNDLSFFTDSQWAPSGSTNGGLYTIWLASLP